MLAIRIGNTGATETFGPSIGRSEFQTNYVVQVAGRQDFDFFCINPMCNKRYCGPFSLAYYTKDGKLHHDWVGQRKVLRSTVN